MAPQGAWRWLCQGRGARLIFTTGAGRDERPVSISWGHTGKGHSGAMSDSAREDGSWTLRERVCVIQTLESQEENALPGHGASHRYPMEAFEASSKCPRRFQTLASPERASPSHCASHLLRTFLFSFPLLRPFLLPSPNARTEHGGAGDRKHHVPTPGAKTGGNHRQSTDYMLRETGLFFPNHCENFKCFK